MFLYSFYYGGDQSSSAASSQSKTWQTDSDWSSWSMDKTSLVSSYDSSQADGGVSLSKIGSGYQINGTTEYRFSPGGTNDWIEASYEAEGVGVDVSKYMWVAISDKNQVAQIDPLTMEIVAMHNVGIDPSRTAIGCNNDVWVANRSKGASNSQVLAHTISHIYFDASGKARVKTLKIRDSANEKPIVEQNYEFHSINVQKKDGKCFVYVGSGNDNAYKGNMRPDNPNTRVESSVLFKIDGDTFDSRTSIQGAELVGKPLMLPLAKGEDGGHHKYPVWGSTMDKSGNFIYLQGAPRDGAKGTLQIDIRDASPIVYVQHLHQYSSQVNKSEADVLATDAYGYTWMSNYNVDGQKYITIYEDNYYNFVKRPQSTYHDDWYSAGYSPVYTTDGLTLDRIMLGFGGSDVPKGNSIVIIPSSKADPTKKDLLVLTESGAPGKYYMYEILRKANGQPSWIYKETERIIDLRAEYSDPTEGNAICGNTPEDSPSDAALAYNDNLDLIAVPRGCNKAIRLSASSNYAVASYHNISSDGTGKSDTYNNFLKSVYDIPSSSLSVVYSNQPFSASNPGLSDISTVADSSDLFIRATFTGDGSLTPILKSLVVNYETNDGGTIVKKETYNDSSFNNKEGTFENDQRVYVKLTIYQPSDVLEAVSVYDEIINVKKGSIRQENPVGGGVLASTSPPNDIFGAMKLEFKFISGMNQGENIIRYSYVAAD